MKNLLLFLFCGFSSGSFGQVNSVMPPEAEVFYNNAMHSIKPQIVTTIEKNANNLKGKKINADSLSKSLRKTQALKNAAQPEIEAITILIMVRTSKNADADLKDIVVNLHKNNDENTSTNGVPNKVQTILSNKSDIAESISLLMKKISGSQGTVIDNLR